MLHTQIENFSWISAYATDAADGSLRTVKTLTVNDVSTFSINNKLIFINDPASLLRNRPNSYLEIIYVENKLHH